MNSAEPKRMLIVEDSARVRGLMVDALGDAGYQIETTRDGEAAWTALVNKHYDLLVTDDLQSRSAGLASILKIRTVSCIDCLQS